MDKLRAAIESEFPEQGGHRRLLGQVDGLLHRHANLIVHHSFLSVGGAIASIGNRRITYDVGVSERFILQALFTAFFSYVHLTSLVVQPQDEQELTNIWDERRGAFTVERSR
jgi:hypothetical protein